MNVYKLLIGSLAIAAVAANTIYIVYEHDQRLYNACRAKGGVVVSTPGRNWTCIKAEVIK